MSIGCLRCGSIFLPEPWAFIWWQYVFLCALLSLSLQTKHDKRSFEATLLFSTAAQTDERRTWALNLLISNKPAVNTNGVRNTVYTVRQTLFSCSKGSIKQENEQSDQQTCLAYSYWQGHRAQELWRSWWPAKTTLLASKEPLSSPSDWCLRSYWWTFSDRLLKRVSIEDKKRAEDRQTDKQVHFWHNIVDNSSSKDSSVHGFD